MALALGQNINMDITPERQKAAYENIQKAKALSLTLSQSEKDYIEALSKRYTNVYNPDLTKLAIDYHQAMKALMQKYPDDPEAAVLFADGGLDLIPWKQ
jgi:uncharacterized pyridoxamine 5'-phosphate oxidase family protein